MKYLKFLVSPIFMGILFIVFAVAMAVATFIENDFGSQVAYSSVYNTKWFELLLLLLAVNLAGQMIAFRLYRKEKLPGFLFHFSFLLMICGAAITRYTGWEGSMHIREGESQDKCYSSEKYLSYKLKDNSGTTLAEEKTRYTLTSVSADEYSEQFESEGRRWTLDLARIIPNAEETVAEGVGGEPVVSLMLTRDMTSSDKVILRKGEVKSSSGISIGFEAGVPADVVITSDSGRFSINSPAGLGVMSMMGHDASAVDSVTTAVMGPMQIFTVNDVKIIPEVLSLSASVKVQGINPAERQTGRNAFIFNLTGEGKSSSVYLWDNEAGEVARAAVNAGNNRLEIAYGPEETILPFTVRLNDFILDRYPGSNSPSGYKSDVVLSDPANGVEKPFLIFMNNILKYQGYRFYQSSYDQDEKGTILSVSHDRAGMLVTYAGYAMLIVFIILQLLNRNSLFRTITHGHWQSALRRGGALALILAALSGLSTADAQKFVPDNKVAGEFGKVLVQDQKGRTKPLFTLSNDILRKVTRENTWKGMSSMQFYLGFYLDFNNWKEEPVIKVSDKELRRQLGIRGDYGAFSDFVDLGQGTYKISDLVNAAYSKPPNQRSKTDKELMKVDERVNILYMVYTGDFLRLFPLRDGSHDWVSPADALQKAAGKEDSAYIQGIVPALTEALQNNNAASLAQAVKSVSSYQQRFASYDIPTASKTKVELLYYRLSIFERLFPYYGTVGLVMLIGLIVMVIKGSQKKSLVVSAMGWLLFAGFLAHTLGLGMRWYISGHSPMSNGYESMIFISWVTLLAGLIFSRKSAFALSATGVLASMTLMVAHLSFMDPEITNLVPVLKSYWLTLHVSVITGSYGFLGLGAILGLIVMVLLVLSNNENRDRISKTIDELSVINYRTLTLGLYFLTIGTFLGAVWANESWGRYWGWDPKETWSLITIVIYSLVIHSRLIPGMKDVYTFNLISLFAFSSVLMTYFGVNYYLSGLHSYAGGDPVPVPVFVYVAVILLTALSWFAFRRYSRFTK
jgi:cytochrome c-type biogenesis protein CcsB